MAVVAFNAMVLVVRVLTMDLLRIGWLDRVVISIRWGA